MASVVSFKLTDLSSSLLEFWHWSLLLVAAGCVHLIREGSPPHLLEGKAKSFIK